jgi:hypothetical protein
VRVQGSDAESLSTGDRAGLQAAIVALEDAADPRVVALGRELAVLQADERGASYEQNESRVGATEDEAGRAAVAKALMDTERIAKSEDWVPDGVRREAADANASLQREYLAKMSPAAFADWQMRRRQAGFDDV